MTEQDNLGSHSQSMINTLGSVSFGDGVNHFTFAPQQIIQISPDKIKLETLIPVSPYMGLKPFEGNEFDTQLFFGRDQLILRLMQTLTERNLVLLLGASGSGKSSVIKAGLIPKLRKSLGTRFCELSFKPQNDPFLSLFISLATRIGDQTKAAITLSGQPEALTQIVTTLKRSEDYWLIYIDQFEELFTSSEPEKRDRFIQGLGQLYQFLHQSQNQSVKIVMTMRADFLDRFDPFPMLGEIVRGNIELITTMYEDELRQAIEQPAAKHGVVFEDGLVKTIIDDIKGQVGSLPLLQYTLDLLWKQDDIADPNNPTKPHPHTDRTLNNATYTTLGGVRGALQTHVEEVYSEKLESSVQQEAAKQIFLKLVQWVPGEGGQFIPVSKRRLYSNFQAGVEVETLQVFVRERLIVSSSGNLNQDVLQSNLTAPQQATVEIAHEILISVWERLKGWIDEAKDVLIVKSQLQADMSRYAETFKENAAKANDELLVGSRLERILELWDDGMFDLRNIPLEAEEITFIEKSLEWRDRQLAEKRDQIKKLTDALTKFTLQEQISRALNLLSITPHKALDLAISTLGLSLRSYKEVLPFIINSLHKVVEYPTEILSFNDLFDGSNKTISGFEFIGKSRDISVSYDEDYERFYEIWNLSGEVIRQVSRPIMYSHSGKFLISKDEQETDFNQRINYIYDIKNKKDFYINDYYLLGVCFSPNEQTLAALAICHAKNSEKDTGKEFFDKELLLLDLKGSVIAKLNTVVGAEEVFFDFSSNGDFLYAAFILKSNGEYFSKICLWSINTGLSQRPGILLWESEVHQGFSYPIIVSSDHQKIVAEFRNQYNKDLDKWESGAIRKWSMEGELQETIYHEKYVISMSFIASDIDSLVYSDNENNLYFLKGSQCVWMKATEIHWNRIKIIVNSDQGIIATLSNEIIDAKHYTSLSINTVCLWDFSGNLIRQLPSDKSKLAAFSPYASLPIQDLQDVTDLGSFFIDSNNAYITSVNVCGQVSLWTWCGEFLRELLPAQSQEGIVEKSSISYNTEFLALLVEGKLRVWDLRNSLIAHHKVTTLTACHITNDIKLDSLFFSSPNLLVASVISSNYSGFETKTSDVRNLGDLLLELKIHLRDIKINLLSNREIIRTTTSWECESFRIEGLESGEIIVHYEDEYKSWKAHNSGVTSIDYCYEYQVIATGDGQGEIRLWNLQGEVIIDKFQRIHQQAITSLSFSPDGQMLASGDSAGNICIWRVGWLAFFRLVCEHLQNNFSEKIALGEISQDACDTCKRYILHPKATELNQQGIDKLELKSYQEATRLFNEAIEHNSEHVGAYYNRGKAYIFQGDFQRSSEDLGQAIFLMKSQVQVLSVLLYRSIRFQSKKKHRYTFDSFVSLSEICLTAIFLLQSTPNLADIYFYRGWSHFKLRELQKAKVDWQAADKVYEMQMNNSTSARKVKEFLSHPSIKNLEVS